MRNAATRDCAHVRPSEKSRGERQIVRAAGRAGGSGGSCGDSLVLARERMRGDAHVSPCSATSCSICAAGTLADMASANAVAEADAVAGAADAGAGAAAADAMEFLYDIVIRGRSRFARPQG